MHQRTRAADAARLSHELLTPLSLIAGYAELLLARDDDGTRLESGREILAAVSRLSALIDDLVAEIGETVEYAGAHHEPKQPSRLRAGAARACPVRRILIADDDSTLRQLVRLTLPAEGFQIVEARDGDDALQQIGVRTPDLIVLDWNMPGRSGADVLDQLQRDGIEVPVIVLTAETRPNHRALANALGAQTFLTKPFSPLELLSAVESVLPNGI
jgi:CheY-like chemotaxis protein